MAIPTTVEFTDEAKVGASNGLLDAIDADAPLAAKIRIYSDDRNTILAQIDLNYPAGTVNGTTGQLTLSISGPDTSANNTGTAVMAAVLTNNDAEILALPCKQGDAAESNYLVMSTLSIVAGTEVQIDSATIG